MFDHLTKCYECPLAEHNCPKVSAVGPENAEILIIGEAPGSNEVMQRTPFVGESGKLLRSVLEMAGVDPKKCFITNAVICRPPNNDTPRPEAWLACRERLIEEIKHVRPKKILTVGGVAYSALMGSPVSLSITKNRGIGQMFKLDWNVLDEVVDVDDHLESFLVPTLHPAAVLRNPDQFREIAEDIQKLASQSAPLPFPDIQTFVSRSIEEALGFFDVISDASMVSIDLETTGRDPITDEIVTLGLGVKSSEKENTGYSFIIRRRHLDSIEVQTRLLEFFFNSNARKAFHNLKFDLQFLEVYFHQRLRIKNVTDTMLMHYALDERTGNSVPGHGLKSLARRYDIPDYHFAFDNFWNNVKAIVEERGWKGPIWDIDDDRIEWGKYYEYHGLDCYITVSLCEDLSTELVEESPELLNLVDDILVPGTVALAEIELRGTKIDPEYLRQQKVILEKEIAELRSIFLEAARELGLHEDPIDFDVGSVADIDRLASVSESPETVWELFGSYRRAINLNKPRRISREKTALLKLAEDAGLYSPGRKFNPSSTADQKKFLGLLGVQADMTDKDSLQLILEDPRLTDKTKFLIEKISEYRQKTKFLSTYIIGLLEKADSQGFVHPDYLIFGTATGRLSCQEPNLQNIPTLAGPIVKNGFIPSEPGWAILNVDYSQLELRVAALLSQDANLISAYQNEEDIHIKVAAAMFKKPPEQITKFERYLAKYVDFGVIYGRSAESLVDGWEMEYYVKQGGKRWTLPEAEVFLNSFLNEFGGLKEFISKQHDLVIQQHYIETLMGRRRRFPYISWSNKNSVQRQAVNSPIQSLASDLTFTALTRLHESLDPEKCRILFTVHDSIVFEVRLDALSESLTKIKYEMTQNIPVSSNVPFRADAEVGLRWGEVEKVTQEMLECPERILSTGGSKD